MADAQSGWRRRVLRGSPAQDETPEEIPVEPQTTTIDPGCEIEGTLTLDRSISIEA